MFLPHPAVFTPGLHAKEADVGDRIDSHLGHLRFSEGFSARIL
jgi:hypothetical protein